MNGMRKFLTTVVLAASLVIGGVGYNHYASNAPTSFEPVASNFASDVDWRSAWDRVGAAELCCAHSAVVDAIQGDEALRFTVNLADDSVKGRKRAELRLPAAVMGATVEYQVDVLIENDWVSDGIPVTVLQWHGVPDIWFGEHGRPPPLRVLLLEDEWWIPVQWDGNRVSDLPLVSDAALRGSELLWRGPLAKGERVRWRFEVKWSPDADGMVRVWKDGELIIERDGANCYRDVLAPYFKYGLYAPTWDEQPERSRTDTRSLVVDNVLVAYQSITSE